MAGGSLSTAVAGLTLGVGWYAIRGWRMCFVMIGLISLAMAMLCHAVMIEPSRACVGSSTDVWELTRRVVTVC